MAFALLLLINSCKKESANGEKIDPSRAKEMQAYKNGPKVETISFDQFKAKANLNSLGLLKKDFIAAPTSKDKLMAINNPQTYVGFALNTDSIRVMKVNGHTIYVFTAKLYSKRAVSFQNLTIDEGPDQTVAFINTYTPTKKWINDWKKGKPGKFEGDISVVYLNLDNTTSTTVGAAPVNGKISAIKNTNTTANGGDGCTTTTYYHEVSYNCGSGSHGPGDPNCVLTGDDAAGYAIVSSTIITCDPNHPGVGGGGTSPTPPGEYAPCEGVLQPGSAIKTTGKVMTTPPTECDPVVPVVKEIINNITDPCLKTTTDEALASNKDVKGFLSDLINNYAGLNNGVKIELLSGNINQPAIINPKFEPTTGAFLANITFQNGYYNDVSKEFVVATLIHEVVHAYLHQTNSNYRDLPEEAQHNFLFTHFIQDMAIYLINKYSMPAPDAYGLAWSGIGGSYNDANDEKLFPTGAGLSMTKGLLGSSSAPYKYIGTNAKGTPNCPPN